MKQKTDYTDSIMLMIHSLSRLMLTYLFTKDCKYNFAKRKNIADNLANAYAVCLINSLENKFNIETQSICQHLAFTVTPGKSKDLIDTQFLMSILEPYIKNQKQITNEIDIGYIKDSFVIITNKKI